MATHYRVFLAAALATAALAGAAQAQEADLRADARICISEYAAALRFPGSASNGVAINARIAKLSDLYDLEMPEPLDPGEAAGSLQGRYLAEVLSSCENVFAHLPAFQPEVLFDYLAEQDLASDPDFARFCAQEYLAVTYSTSAYSLIDLTWIDPFERANVLVTRFGLDQAALDAMALIAGLAVNDPLLVQFLVEDLAACDRTFGFEPIARMLPEPQAAEPALTDFDCAVAYWLYGAFTPDEQPGALERARYSVAAHMQANPGADQAGVEQEVIAAGQLRGQQIMTLRASLAELMQEIAAPGETSGDRLDAINRRYESVRQELETVEMAVLSEVSACEQGYGRTPAGGQ